jgi:hypothetical protein
MQEPHKQLVTLHTYREDTHRKAPKWAFLGGCSIPLRSDEDDPAVTAMATAAADEHGGTCKILSR